MFIEHYGYRPDTGGAGTHRGGVGISRVYQFEAPSAGICMTYKTRTRPWGIGEGGDGLNNHVIINPGTGANHQGSEFANHLATATSWSTTPVVAAAGAIPSTGNQPRWPRTCAMGSSPWSAAAATYGVVVDPDNFAVDGPGHCGAAGGPPHAPHSGVRENRLPRGRQHWGV